MMRLLLLLSAASLVNAQPNDGETASIGATLLVVLFVFMVTCCCAMCIVFFPTTMCRRYDMQMDVEHTHVFEMQQHYPDRDLPGCELMQGI
jgi:hypothetical protein